MNNQPPSITVDCVVDNRISNDGLSERASSTSSSYRLTSSRLIPDETVQSTSVADDEDAATLSDGGQNEVGTFNSSVKYARTTSASSRSDNSPVQSETGNRLPTPVEQAVVDSDDDVEIKPEEKTSKTAISLTDKRSQVQSSGPQNQHQNQKTASSSRRSTLNDDRVSTTLPSSPSPATGFGQKHAAVKPAQSKTETTRKTASASIRRSVSPTRRRRRLDAASQRRSLPYPISASNTHEYLAPRTTTTLAEEHREMLFRKFRLISRLTVLLLRVLKDRIRRNKTDDELFAGSVFVRFDETDDNEQSIELELSQPMYFNKHRYRANHKLRVTDETRRILSKLPGERTESELQYVQRALLSNKACADYPVRMQKKIAGVGVYHRFESKRVIVRQGQKATAFYFILSGSVVVLVRDHPLGVPQPRAVLRRGMTFGELALVQGIPRQSTVVAIDAVELMGLDVESFYAIFMLGGVKKVEDPDQQQFLRSLWFLAGWPIDKLMEETNKCVFNYFRNGDVLVRDSKYSNWIVVVKSGSLKVLKMLKKIDPQNHRNNENEENEKRTDSSAELSADNIRLQLLETRYLLSELNIPLRTDKRTESSSLCTPTGIGVINWTTPRGAAPNHNPVTNAQQNSTKLTSSVSGRPGRVTRADVVRQILTLPNVGNRSKDADTNADGIETSPELHPNVEPSDFSMSTVDRTRLNQDANQGQSHGERRIRRVSKMGPLKKLELAIRSDYDGAAPPVRRRHGSVDAAAHSMVGGRQQIRTVMNDLDASNNGFKQLTQADFNPEFIHVQTLSKGDVFGLQETILGSQPSVSVVSNGAECVLIDKSYYKEHAPKELLKRLAAQCSPYPSDEDLQQKLSSYVKWRQFCATTFNETVRQIRCNAAV